MKTVFIISLYLNIIQQAFCFLYERGVALIIYMLCSQNNNNNNNDNNISFKNVFIRKEGNVLFKDTLNTF